MLGYNEDGPNLVALAVNAWADAEPAWWLNLQAHPDAIVELKDDDPIFHTVYDLDERYQVSGLNIVSGMPYERGGIVPHWRGVVDEKGRVQVAICFNMDVGDSWEWADYPMYPERLSSLGFRMGVNYVMYAMTR